MASFFAVKKIIFKFKFGVKPSILFVGLFFSAPAAASQPARTQTAFEWRRLSRELSELFTSWPESHTIEPSSGDYRSFPSLFRYAIKKCLCEL